MNISGTRKWWALVALTLSVLVAGLDGTVLSLALPTLAGALHASEADLQWFVAAYSLALAAMLLPAGLLGDRYGRKKMLLVALALFGIASLGAAYAPTSVVFIAARAVLGLASAFLITLSMSVLPVLFTDEERPRAVGIWAAANFLALPIGPILGGWMLNHFWWGSVFLINVPVVVLAVVAVALLLPESRSAQRPGLDPAGVLTSSVGLAVLIYGVIEAGQKGWGDAVALVSMAAGVLLLVGFVLWERRLSGRPDGQPLVDLALFRSASFTWGTILAALGVFAMFGVLFTAPQYMQAILGADPQGSGLRLLPVIAGLVAGAGLADRVARKAGAKLTVALGFGLLSAGLIVGATTTVTSGDWFLVAWTALIGAGMGLALSTAADGALAELSAERSGVGSALMQAVQKVGGPFSAAILGSVLNATYRDHLNLAGLPAQAVDAVQKSVFGGLAVARQIGSAPLLDTVRTAFVSGMDVALWVCGGVAALGIVLTLLFLPARSHAASGAATIGTTEVKGIELGHEQVA
jgi:DHA2 family multidrug resistance protein-like MFS transporter